ncbi:metallophosphoesterase [Phytoactinopolyspora mesophila]|uniref:DNA repair exonuclease n=1 Tax=Phytoactinopolyspora mesophila TaxID=2650750 RepID=A0A7K3M856_9ACTN|nr:DNA repair exonuclease [Phytoactinopolyspora mesophila]
MTVLVHAADLHLNSPLYGLQRHYPNEDWHAPTRQALPDLVTAAVGESADVVVLAGDITDRDWYDDHTARSFREAMTDLHDAGIVVFVIDGNHDAACGFRRDLAGSPDPLPPNVWWFDSGHAHTVVLEELGLAVHGRGLPAAVVAEDLTATFPAGIPGLLNVGIQHTSLDNSRPGQPCAPTTLDALLQRDYQYWALGHVHPREVVRTAPWVVYSGNTQGRTARESGPKGVTVTTAEGERITDVRHRELSLVRWAHLAVAAADDVDTTIERTDTELGSVAQLLQDGQRLAVRIEITGGTWSEQRLADVAAAIRDAAGTDPRYLVENIGWAGRLTTSANTRRDGAAGQR